MSQTITPKHRRYSLLLSLYNCANSFARVPELVREMELVHSLAVSSDLVRADLIWMAEMGLLSFKDDNAQLIERGRDVVYHRADFPG